MSTGDDSSGHSLSLILWNYCCCYYYYYYHFMALCPWLPGWAGTEETFTHSHPLWSSTILHLHPIHHDPQHSPI